MTVVLMSIRGLITLEFALTKKITFYCISDFFKLRYPKSQIDICVQVIECGGENVTMASMVTAAGCAVASAGLVRDINIL